MSTGRQHYRLYVIQSIPTLKVLDFARVTKTERERAERLAKSAAGAALEADLQVEQQQQHSGTKTFVPGEGQSAQESFKASFTPEEKAQIRELVVNAANPAEIEEIERYVQRGILPPQLSSANRKRPPPTTSTEQPTENNNNSDHDQQPPSNKKARVEASAS